MSSKNVGTAARVIRECNERTFVESEYFQPDDRQIAGRSPNSVWLSTVEHGTELDRNTGKQSPKAIVRIVRWPARNENDGAQKVWRHSSSYSFRSIEEWENTSSLVDLLIDANVETGGFITLPLDEYAGLSTNPDELKSKGSERRKLFAKIRELRNTGSAAEAEKQLFKRRLQLMRSNVRELESVLREYRGLISHEDTTETEVKKFLIEHDAYWMFGLEYTRIEEEVKFPPHENDYSFDLMLQRYDEHWDLVECKGPNENLFDKRTKKRSKPNVKLSEAIGQVITYLYAIDKTWDRNIVQNIVKPKAYMLIGNQRTDRPSERRVFTSYLNNVDLITYSELYERGRSLLRHIKDRYPHSAPRRLRERGIT